MNKNFCDVLSDAVNGLLDPGSSSEGRVFVLLIILSALVVVALVPNYLGIIDFFRDLASAIIASVL